MDLKPARKSSGYRSVYGASVRVYDPFSKLGPDRFERIKKMEDQKAGDISDSELAVLKGSASGGC